ncbi:MAG: orotate phosphoribosyltransferase [Puniceicoccaceae bacterium]
MSLSVEESEMALRHFRESGALLEGHFVLRSGRHSGHFFQCAQVCQYLERISELASLIVRETSEWNFETVLSPAMGGLVIGQEVARQAKARFIFAEKVEDRLELRRNFRIGKGERVLVVEDVITRGGRVDEALAILEATEAKPAGVAVMVDRSDGAVDFGVPLFSLVRLSFPTFEAGQVPASIAVIPPTKPGS